MYASLSLSQSTLFQATNHPIRGHADLQLVTQRALFMTPSPNTSSLPYPSSPASDPHGSPQSSLVSSRGWEEDECDIQYTHFDSGTSGSSIKFHTVSPHHSLNFPTHRYPTNNDFTPLEMPDGSTRLTSNWLPVDCDAGFTIGSAASADDDIAAFGSDPIDSDAGSFHGMKHAFMPSNSTAWLYNG